MTQKKHNIGGVPGRIIFNGERKVDKISINYLEYNSQIINHEELDNQAIKTFHKPDPDLIQWYDIRGLHDTELIQAFGDVFKLHPLILEDIADVHQRPKLDDYNKIIFIKIHALNFDSTSNKIKKENVSLVLGEGFVLSFQENEDDLLTHVRTRIINSKGRIREKGADYLFYAFLDALVDHYFLTIDNLDHNIQELESNISSEPSDQIKKEILQIKKQFLRMRKSIYPLREALIQLSKSDNELIQDNTKLFIRDAYDHLFQIIDSIDTNRDLLSGLQDLYISEISLKMNKVMQVLTIITTIFVPLSFLVGMYGMNFANMPELKYKYAYFILLGFMAIICVCLLYFFRRKKWL